MPTNFWFTAARLYHDVAIINQDFVGIGILCFQFSCNSVLSGSHWTQQIWKVAHCFVDTWPLQPHQLFILIESNILAIWCIMPLYYIISNTSKYSYRWDKIQTYLICHCNYKDGFVDRRGKIVTIFYRRECFNYIFVPCNWSNCNC